MTYRDDQDALLARNDALEDEKARLSEENEKLKAELAAARAPKPAPPKKPEKLRMKGNVRGGDPAKVWKLAGVGTTIFLFAVLTYAGIRCDPEAKEAREQEAQHDRETTERARRERWATIVDVEKCLDEAVVRVHYGLQFDPQFTWGTMVSEHLTGMWGLCEQRMKRATTERLLPPVARVAIADYLAARVDLQRALRPLQDYIEHRDFEEDAYAGGRTLWADAAPAVTAMIASINAARATAIPASRDVIRRAQATRTTRDATWWRIEIGLAQRDLAAVAAKLLAPRGTVPADLSDRAATDRALRPAFDSLIALVETAPIEIRREVRGLAGMRDSLAHYGDPAEGISHVISNDGDLLEKTTAEDAPLLVDAAF